MLKIQPPELAGLTFTECRDRIRAWFQQPASMPDGVIDFIVIEVALKDWAAPGGSPADLADHGPKEWALSFMRRGLSRSPDGPRSPVAEYGVEIELSDHTGWEPVLADPDWNWEGLVGETLAGSGGPEAAQLIETFESSAAGRAAMSSLVLAVNYIDFAAG